MVSVQSYFNNLQENHKHPMDSDHLSSINNLAAVFAHEIRNPLTTVKGYIQLIKPYLIEQGKEHYADIALDEINRANDLLLDLLNLEKPQVSQKQEVALNQLIIDVASLYEGEGLINNIKIDVQQSHDNPVILADDKQLKQVLTNLIKNAIEALIIIDVEYCKQVTLSIKSEVSQACIIVEDNGCGMTDETIKEIFTPFYTTKATGTGIGLPLCKKIIEAHNGSFHISSSIGKGTIMTMTFPLYTQKSGA